MFLTVPANFTPICRSSIVRISDFNNGLANDSRSSRNGCFKSLIISSNVSRPTPIFSARSFFSTPSIVVVNSSVPTSLVDSFNSFNKFSAAL